MPRITRSQKIIFLNCSKLNVIQIHSWIYFLSGFNKLTNINFIVQLLNTELEEETLPVGVFLTTENSLINFNSNFVYLFDSKTLNQHLLQHFNTVHLAPQKEPEFINHLLFPLLEGVRGLNGQDLKPWFPICTLISSMFNGDVYKEAFLKNTADFKELNKIETLVFRPNSNGDEHSNLLEFGERNTSLIYVWLAEDPGLYNVWNFGVRLSSAAYCSNANIDDKRASEHVFELVKALEEDKAVDVASSSLRVTDVKNQLWAESEN